MSYKNNRSPHSGIDETYWNGLDNTAKLFPSITTTRSPNVFRLSAVLFDEVEPQALQTALEKAIAIMPAFALKLHRGLFWYYFDVNDERPIVTMEHTYPCAPIYRAGEKGFLFRVTYYHKRINLEMYHALADGMGAVSFMRVLIYCYFNVISGSEVPEEHIRRESDEAARDFGEDSFVINCEECAQSGEKAVRDPDAYRLGGFQYDGTRLGVTCAYIPTPALLGLAREQGASLSEYITALLIFSIFNTSYRRSSMKRPITISIPVNLRGMFTSNTLRNFFGHMNVGVLPGRDVSFEDILSAVKERFSKCLTREYFERQIVSHVKIERIPGVKFVPIWLKNLIMRGFYKSSEKRHTLTFSNLGRITLPTIVADRVERFEAYIGGSETHVKKASLCSYGDNLTLAFSSTVDDNSLEQFLLSYLASQGIEITVSSNETPPPAKKAKAKPSKEEKSRVKAAKKAVRAEKKAAKKLKKEKK